MSSNPEREWGRPSWPTAPNKKTVRDQDTSGKASFQIRVIAAALVAAPSAVMAGLAVYLVVGNTR